MNKIYIDGIEYHIVEKDSNGGIFVDHPEVPFRKCSFHRIKKSDLISIEQGTVIKTGGHIYASREIVSV